MITRHRWRKKKLLKLSSDGSHSFVIQVCSPNIPGILMLWALLINNFVFQFVNDEQVFRADFKGHVRHESEKCNIPALEKIFEFKKKNILQIFVYIYESSPQLAFSWLQFLNERWFALFVTNGNRRKNYFRINNNHSFSLQRYTITLSIIQTIWKFTEYYNGINGCKLICTDIVIIS